MTQFFSARWTRMSTVATMTILLAACGKGQQAAAPAPAPGKAATPPVAMVDGTAISRDAFNDYLKSLLRGKPVADVTADEKNQVLDQMISMQLIATRAAKDGLDKDSSVASRLDLARTQVLADAGVQKYLKSVTPTDQELHAEYDSYLAGLDKTFQ